MKNVLVTGASGFIGKHLVNRLLDDERVEEIRVILSDPLVIPSKPRIPKLWTEQKIKSFGIAFRDLSVATLPNLKHYVRDADTVFHLAATSVVRDNESDPTRISHNNILATHNLLAACQEGARFIFASSATVYGDSMTRCGEQRPLTPNSIYGATKVASEALVDAYTRLRKIRGTNLRLVANVGTGATHGVVPDFIRKLRSDSPELEVLGDPPGSKKPYCHVEDTVDAMLMAATETCWDCERAVNIGPCDEINIEQLAKAVMFAMEIVKPIRWLGESANWKGDNRMVHIRNDNARSRGWQPSHNSTTAVTRAVLDIVKESRTKDAA